MAARHRKKKAEGGAIKGVQVPGAQVIKEAEGGDEGFKKGGKASIAAFGGKAAKRMDKAPRKAAGGAVKLARGGSPYSAAAKTSRSASSSGSECA